MPSQKRKYCRPNSHRCSRLTDGTQGKGAVASLDGENIRKEKRIFVNDYRKLMRCK
jgi:hypothetical protein